MNYREVRDLTEIILKNFMRVMKDEDKYILLLNGFNSNMYKSLLKNYTIKKMKFTIIETSIILLII